MIIFIVLIGIFIVLVFIVLPFAILDDRFFRIKKEQSCRNIGMEYELSTNSDFDYCIEPNGNAHFARFDCRGLVWNKECTVQIINIRDFRVIEQRGGYIG